MKRQICILSMIAVLLSFVHTEEVKAMSIRFYVIPVDVVILGGIEYRGPKYFQWRWSTDPTWLEVERAYRDYGGKGETTMLICAEVTEAQHAWLSGHTDVFVIPPDLDTRPSPAELSAFEDHLETMAIPADWLTPSNTWREALRVVLGMFATAGKYAVITEESLLDSGVAMNTQLRNYPAYVSSALGQVAMNMGYPWEDVRQNWTTRVLFKWFADQWPSDTFPFPPLTTL